MTKTAGPWMSPLIALATLALVSGCASAASTDEPSTSVAPPTPTATDDRFPAGADENTPECQDASAATVAVVNDAIHAVSAAEGTVETTLPWLSARPDKELGVWTLTGVVVNEATKQGTEGGYLVVWATTDDPTSSAFDGAVLTVGGSAGDLAGLPPLLPGYVGDMESDTPPGALHCGTQRANQN